MCPSSRLILLITSVRVAHEVSLGSAAAYEEWRGNRRSNTTSPFLVVRLGHIGLRVASTSSIVDPEPAPSLVHS